LENKKLPEEYKVDKVKRYETSQETTLLLAVMHCTVSVSYFSIHLPFTFIVPLPFIYSNILSLI
jgi:hypothetical protein